MSTPPKIDRRQAATDARSLIAAGTTAALATLEGRSGTPYVSLVTVALLPACSPVLLLSGLAAHTRNINGDPRASLLYSADFGAADPLTNARVTLLGTIAPSTDDAARQVYLSRHPQSRQYADFGDFAFYALKVERAHFIGGFGRIVDLSRADLEAV